MKEKLRVLIGAIMLVVLIAFTIVINILLTRKDESNLIVNLDPEHQRAMTYEEFKPEDANVRGTDNVKFSAFFLRDLDGDGYAEKVKGTCKSIEATDTLYMEIIVQSEGYLKDGKITIVGKNFFLKTAIPKDAEIKENYINSKTEEIEFENLNNGIQKLITGSIHTGASGNNKKEVFRNQLNYYSIDDNKIILSGVYVDDQGIETNIYKEIKLSVDWYGEVRSSFGATRTQFEDLPNRIDEENRVLNLSFSFNNNDSKEQLLLKSHHVEVTIPDCNGYAPIEVNCSIPGYTYDSETRKLIIDRESKVSGNHVSSEISDDTSITVKLKYPLEAYENSQSDAVKIRVPISSYYEGFNNPNSEFLNPFKSNISSIIYTFNYYKNVKVNSVSISVGSYSRSPYTRYLVSKKKPINLYNEVSDEEVNDNYEVTWSVSIGEEEPSERLIIKETKNGEEQLVDSFIDKESNEISMEDYTTNIGIYFTNATSSLGDEGEINVFDDETGILIKKFTSDEWDKYRSDKPYIFDLPVNHIRIETSNVIQGKCLSVISVKSLDDEKIVNSFTREEFYNLDQIKSNICVYLGDVLIEKKYATSIYENPLSSLYGTLKENGTISTQDTTEHVMISLHTTVDPRENIEGWKNGIFLLKFPDELRQIKVNNVYTITPEINIDSYEIINNDEGTFIKIITSNSVIKNYSITLDLDLSPDPRTASISKDIEVYAYNPGNDVYRNTKEDIYDVDGDGNYRELVCYTMMKIRFIAPNSLTTNQIISEFDLGGTYVIGPQIAELKPIYSQEDVEKQTVRIGAQFKNNYSGTISEVIMQGKIPFVGNTTVISNINLKSQFNTNMTSNGVVVPEELEGKVTVYYSTKESPSKEINDSENGWTLKEDVSNWADIKSWLVDFGDLTFMPSEEHSFYYDVEIPIGVAFNKITYSHHGIYFCLDTPDGKYRTMTEPTKIGIMVADKYNLMLTKYQKDRNKVVQGATYKVSKLGEEGEIEESQTAVTDENGILEMGNLYADMIYEIKEIGTPSNYELNEDAIKIIGNIDRTDGSLAVAKIEGTLKGTIGITKNENDYYKALMSVEDQAKATLKIIKKEKGSDAYIKGAKYKVYGEGFEASGKIGSTNENGVATIKDIKLGEEYLVKESKAPEGYYLNDSQIKFKVEDSNGEFVLYLKNEEDEFIRIDDITSLENYPEIISIELKVENDFPIIEIETEDEAIPKYSLEINKINKKIVIDENGTHEEVQALAGAKFRLYKEERVIDTYITDSNGKIIIDNLNQYKLDRDVDQTYILKEIYAPEGYTTARDTVFRVYDDGDKLVFDEFLNDGQEEKEYVADGNTIKLNIEDNPVFKLIKKDGETGAVLPNTKFAIYNITDAKFPAKNCKGETIGEREVINGKEYYVVTTDSSGEFSLDLPGGIYEAVEVEAPDIKYDIEGQKYYFGIGESRRGDKGLDAIWANKTGAEGNLDLQTINPTEDGGYIVGGGFTGILTLKGKEYVNKGNRDCILIKYNSDREIEWVDTFGGTGTDSVNSVAETKDGGYILGISFNSGSFIIDETTIYRQGSNQDGAVIKLNSEREVEWFKVIGGNSDDYIRSVTETPDRKIIAGGFYSSNEIEVDGESVFNTERKTKGILLKFDNAGNTQWIKNLGNINNAFIYSVSKTIDGGYLVGGYFTTSVEIDGETYNSEGNNSALVIKYDSNDDIEWIKQIDGTDSDSLYTVKETIDGGFIAGGYLSGPPLEGASISGKNTVVKYNVEHEIDWAEKVEGSIYSLSVDYDGGYILAGSFSNSITIGRFDLNTEATSDGLIIKYVESEVAKVAVKEVNTFGGEANETVSKIVDTPDGGYLLVGEYRGDFEVDGHTLINRGDEDSYVIKFYKDGTVDWVSGISGDNWDIFGNAVCTSDGGYLVGGYYRSQILHIGDSYEIEKGNATNNGLLIKYSADGEVEWTERLGNEVTSIENTKDNGVLVGVVYLNSTTIGQYNFSGRSEGGLIVKYNEDFLIEWVKELNKNTSACRN